jgi:hypothetical protein
MVEWKHSWKTKMTDRPAPGHAPARGTDAQNPKKFPDVTVHKQMEVRQTNGKIQKRTELAVWFRSDFVI